MFLSVRPKLLLTFQYEIPCTSQNSSKRSDTTNQWTSCDQWNNAFILKSFEKFLLYFYPGLLDREIQFYNFLNHNVIEAVLGTC